MPRERLRSESCGWHVCGIIRGMSWLIPQPHPDLFDTSPFMYFYMYILGSHLHEKGTIRHILDELWAGIQPSQIIGLHGWYDLECIHSPSSLACTLFLAIVSRMASLNPI
jgi:hypothetical protein